MQSTKQAHKFTHHAYQGLFSLLNTLFVQKNTKMLISNEIKILKDGKNLLNNLIFTNPIVNLIVKSSLENNKNLGDGTILFVIFGFFVFEYFDNLDEIKNDLEIIRRFLVEERIEFDFESELQKIKERILKNKLDDMNIISKYDSKYDLKNKLDDMNIIKSDINNLKKENIISIKEKNENILLNLISTALNTKMDENLSNLFSLIICDSFTKNYHLNEMMPYYGNIKESKVINGLILDHSGRHPLMPKKLENCCILISNLNLEYENTEINSNIFYKNIYEKEKMILAERTNLNKRIERILNLNLKLKKENRNLILLTERGIDLLSLDKLKNILCLRRVKRRNLERLINSCGGNIVTLDEDICEKNLGYCESIRVEEFGEKSYTFIEKVPFQNIKTILIAGNNDYERERIKIAIMNCYKIMEQLRKNPFYLKIYDSNELNIFKRISLKLENENKKRTACSEALYKIFENINKIKNLSKNSLESWNTLDKTLFNSGTVTSTLLMVDEIIKAGRTVKEEKKERDDKMK